MQVDQVPGHFRHQVDGETNLSCPVCLVEAENSNVIEVSRAVRPDSSTGLQERIHRLEQIVEDLANANYYQSESCREDEQYSAYPQRMQALRHTRQLGMSILLHSEKLALLISRIPLVELISTKEEPAMLDLHIGKRSSTRYLISKISWKASAIHLEMALARIQRNQSCFSV
ncbi:hypothetical protein DTO166G4_4328 [Paecilomyces variotii]|nr:hypothetical protein DTO166G4_4328 [Paecilomyces variotii]KAJ9241753.1 hypothetical protein DTO166G5_829 [Paecilomyces variotii]KAJ9364966.1 hypothetical protein DTO280E4_1261 [Paecilomyces variotii]